MAWLEIRRLFVVSITDHKTMFSRQQIANADTARALYRKIRHPDEAEFLSILQMQPYLCNCPVTLIFFSWFLGNMKRLGERSNLG
jgi:hypothetical protein